MIANRAAKVYTSFNNEIATYHPNNIVEVSQSRHVLVPQNTGTFDASYRAGKPFQKQQGHDRCVLRWIYRYAIDDLLFRGLLRFDFSPETTKPLAAESKTEITVTGLKQLYRKNKNKPSYYLLPKNHDLRYAYSHCSFRRLNFLSNNIFTVRIFRKKISRKIKWIGGNEIWDFILKIAKINP